MWEFLLVLAYLASLARLSCVSALNHRARARLALEKGERVVECRIKNCQSKSWWCRLACRWRRPKYLTYGVASYHQGFLFVALHRLVSLEPRVRVLVFLATDADGDDLAGHWTKSEIAVLALTSRTPNFTLAFIPKLPVICRVRFCCGLRYPV
jgi:hypothetical protein